MSENDPQEHDAWREERYREVFEQTHRQIEDRRRTDPEFTVDRLEELLNSMYNLQGHNWVGRGIVEDVTDSATIAAYESVLARWRRSS